MLSVYRVAVNLRGEGKDMAIVDMLVLASIKEVKSEQYNRSEMLRKKLMLEDNYKNNVSNKFPDSI